VGLKPPIASERRKSTKPSSLLLPIHSGEINPLVTPHGDKQNLQLKVLHKLQVEKQRLLTKIEDTE
jgi:hypothetical protein